MDTSKNFYVGIEDSTSFRRNLLEASRSIVSILKANHKIKVIRQRKKKNLDMLKQHVKEINQLVQKMDASMPDVGIRASKFKREVIKEEKKEELPKKEDIEVSELDTLEKQIREIDQKLNNLQ